MVAAPGDAESVAPFVAVFAPNDWITAIEAPADAGSCVEYAAVSHGTPGAASVATSNVSTQTPDHRRRGPKGGRTVSTAVGSTRPLRERLRPGGWPAVVGLGPRVACPISRAVYAPNFEPSVRGKTCLANRTTYIRQVHLMLAWTPCDIT